MAHILVTGGAGYIGSHVCKALWESGHTPITLDNLERGHCEAVKWGPFIFGDIRNFDAVVQEVATHPIAAVIHLAAYAYIKESTEKPNLYFENNVTGSILLFEALRALGLKKVVFSSTCATYGHALEDKISESHPQNPINPYGLSKLMVEEILTQYQQHYGFDVIGLRYFNAAGADPGGEIGESHDPEPHILPNLITASLLGQPVAIFGRDYPTHDGTCVRDFIHVSDLADAHVAAVEKLLASRPQHTFYNIGNARGHSLLELAKEVEAQTQKPLQLVFEKRRHGDPASLVCASDRFQAEFEWTPKRSELNYIVSTALNWHRKEKSPHA